DPVASAERDRRLGVGEWGQADDAFTRSQGDEFSDGDPAGEARRVLGRGESRDVDDVELHEPALGGDDTELPARRCPDLRRDRIVGASLADAAGPVRPGGAGE